MSPFAGILFHPLIIERFPHLSWLLVDLCVCAPSVMSSDCKIAFFQYTQVQEKGGLRKVAIYFFHKALY